MAVLNRILVLLGGGALLLMALIETVAVVGRYVGMALHGSIEIVQAAVVVTGASALLAATIVHGHASIHLLDNRLPPRLVSTLDRASDLLAVVFFATLAAGSAWLASDLWSAHEESDLLAIPLVPLRVFATLALLGVTAAFLIRATGRSR